MVAVVAHSRKNLGGGLPELRRALAQGAELIFVWGGDGTVQRCVGAVAGTANLLAANLQIPGDLAAAVRVGLHGARRRLDTGTVNGEHFRNLTADRVKATVKADGHRFFTGRVSCVLVGNVGRVLGWMEAFTGTRPDDGLLDLGVVTAKNPVEWARTPGRVAAGQVGQSPFVEVTRGRKFVVRFSRPVPYELDGGARPAVDKLRIKVRPASITVCVPAGAAES